MIEKECFKCNLTLPLGEFYKHPQMADGHLNKCKGCTKKDVRQNLLDNKDYYRKYEKQRNKLPGRVEARKKYQGYLRKYYPEKLIEYNKKSNDRYPEKQKARNIFSNAIRDGKIVRQSCQVCGKPNAQGHHYDYSKPLDVVWLCSKHHAEIHHG